MAGNAHTKTVASAAGVNVCNSEQSAIRDRMNANSQIWHGADEETKKGLEKENRRLAAQLGSGVTFDSATGTWSGMAQLPAAAPVCESSILPGSRDYSSYIKDMNEARQDAALAELEAAYQKNVAELEAAGAGIAPAYQAARSRAAAEREREKRNFAEYANAHGLHSGAAGQAELARGVALQHELGAIHQAEADALAELDLHRTRTANEYQAAIAAAKAGGAYDLAAALYQEAVRVDQSLVSTALSQAGLNRNKWSADYTVWQDARSRADMLAAQEQSAARNATDNAASYGELWLQHGLMPSDSMLAAMGITRKEAQRLIDRASEG